MKIENPSATYLAYENLFAARQCVRDMRRCATPDSRTRAVDHTGAEYNAIRAREFLDAARLHLKNVPPDRHPWWLAKRIAAWSADEVSLSNEVDDAMNELLRLQLGGGS